MRFTKRPARVFPASAGWNWALGCAGSRLSADAFGTAPTPRDFTAVSFKLGSWQRNRPTAVVGPSCPRNFCPFRDGLAGQPESRDRLRLLLRTIARGGTTNASAAEEVERVADLPFEDEQPRARSVLERGEPLVHGGFVLDTAGLA
jgi:hypothetical protein